MSLTDQTNGIPVTGKKALSTSNNPAQLTVSEQNPFAAHDYALVVNTFEMESVDWVEEDYAMAYHYKDVYSTRNFSERVSRQMQYYPGVHQTSTAQGSDPSYDQAKTMSDERMSFWNSKMDDPDAFMNGMRSRQQDFDYSKIFGTDASAKTRAEELGKVLTTCIPCFDRVLDLESLMPNMDLLEVHLLNIKIRTDILDQIKKLFSLKDLQIDICELINFFAHLCPSDLLAIVAVLTQYLAKLNLDIKFNINFIISLVGAILSPFLDSLSQWLDKFIELLLRPVICIVDHINEFIITAQNVKIPFSSVSGSVDADLGLALPGHDNVAINSSRGGEAGLDTANTGWVSGEVERFSTPDSQKYQPTAPEYPVEEARLSALETREANNPSWSVAEREQVNKEWKKLKEKEKQREVDKTRKVEQRTKRDSNGTVWSKDEIPQSEKEEKAFNFGNRPPEKQTPPRNAEMYFDPSPLVNSIVQTRNIMQGAIRYIQDWFDYALQMIYDLLGTDAGWMSNKAGSTQLKTNIIQIIAVIKAIIEAVSKNGLKCGIDTNFDENQLKFVLEEGLNQFSPTKYEVLDNGTIKVIPPTGQKTPSTKDSSSSSATSKASEKDAQATKNQDTGTGSGPGSDKGTQKKQKTIESGIIIKNCLRDITQQELTQARAWIAEYERRVSGNV